MRFAEPRTLRRLAVVSFVAMLVVGCRSQFFPRGEPDPGEVPLFLTSQGLILHLANTDYDFGPKRDAIPRVDPGFPGPTAPDSPAPHMTIETMTMKAGLVHQPPRIIARITSDRDYPLMGIYEGVNYVWRNTWDTTTVAAATWINRITSDNLGQPDHQLVRDTRLNHLPPSGTHHEPSLLKLAVNSIAFELCLDDPLCQSGHCGHF
jgi:hypothetical protein